MIRTCLIFLSFGVGFYAWTGELILDEGSVMAVVTHKGGLAKGLAHNHFIAPAKVDSQLTLTDGPESLTFTISLDVNDLEVDPPELSAKWYPRIEALGLLDEAFGEVSEKDRGKIRKTMLGKSQLRADRFPTITARGEVTATRETTVGEVTFTHVLTVSLTIRDVTRDIEIPANISVENGRLSLEATVRMRFSDFGIKPYSAMLGAVSNKDEIDFYVNLMAEPAK